MTFLAALSRRLPWLNVSAGCLLALLQRTPAVRTFVQAADYVLTSRAGELLRAGFTAAALGALHSRAGATTFVPSSPNPVRGTVGQRLEFGFTYTGTPSSPATFTFSGSLPPGLSFIPAPIGNVIRSGTPAVVGTPTTAGTFTIQVQGFNAEGLTNNLQQRIVFEISGGTATGPTITTQPQSQTVAAGSNVTFSVQATGSPAPTYQWTKNGAPIGGATTSSLALPGVQAADAGSYAVVVTVTGATPVTSAAAILTVTTGGTGGPEITSQPLSVTAALGGTAALTVSASGSGLTYQWAKNNVPIPQATEATLLLRSVGASDAGAYTVTVANASGPRQSSAATLAVENGTSRLVNLSVRANLASAQRLIVGFSTNGQKTVLLRGIGPTLGAFGVTGAYADPRLELYNDSPAMIMQNEDWSAALAPAFTAVGAFALTNGSKDAALQTTISGSHTAQITGPGSGVVLTEVYDAGGGTAVRLVNVSARNVVGTGANILIAGFVVDGTVGKTLLIRAVGPTLAQAPFGVQGTLVDPKLEIFDGTTKIVENDNWSPAVGGIFGSVGAFGLLAGSRDAALLVTLPPGSGYSAQVSGVGGGTGEALVEVYEVP